MGWLWTMLPISLLPVIHILGIPIGDNIIHDRYLTYPLTFFALGITPLLVRLVSDPVVKQQRLKWAIMALITCLLTANIVNVRITIPLWKNDFSLWSWGVARSPESMFARSNLGSVYFENKQYSMALEQGLKAAELRPEFYAGFRLAGRSLLELGEKQDGLAFLQAAVDRLGTTPSADTFIDLADAYMRTGQYKKAETILLSVSTKEPLNRNLNRTFGILYTRLGDQKRADQAFEKSQLFYPSEIQAELRKKYAEDLAGDKYPKRPSRL
jgi:tetratricopeptide (TPR) repeat protein